MKRRLLAFVLVLAMLLSVTPVAVFAAETVVAKIGDTEYGTLSAALNAAADGATIELIWAEGDAPISMAGSVFGNKTVTITGTATVDWSKGWLFVGRGGEGDGKLIFNNANLTAYANSGRDVGIHVSGHEKGSTTKNNGTVEMINSNIELDYLINKGTMVVDNTVLYVHAGFGIAGRPASETEDGKDATATITIKNGSNVTVKNENGMGMGYEGNGILNLENSSFTCNSAMNVYDEDGSAFNVSGECTLNIKSVTGQSLNLLDGAIIKDSTVGGEVFVAGKVTFRGDNTFDMLYDFGTLKDYYGTTANMEWTVEKGASVTLTKEARYGLGYGDKVTIYGNLTDALNARETLTENDVTVFMHGLVAQESSGWNQSSSLTVKDAYVVIGSNNSFGNTPGNYGGTYKFTFDNVVLDSSRITFYAANSKTEFTFNKSDVKVGTFMTRDPDSVFTLTDTKLVSTTTTNGTDEGNYHAGTLVLNNSSLTYSAPMVMENGTLTLDMASTLTAPKISGDGKIVIDATNYVAGAKLIDADLSGFTGDVETVGNDNVTVSLENGQLVIKAKVAKIGDVKYDSLQEAIDAAEAANTKDIVIDLVNNATLDITAWQTLAIGGANTETITINGNGHTLVFNKLNSDWNHVATNNNAKLILSDMTLSDSGYNNGPWNRYDINFACNVELNNVVSNKALAFKADATLNNVTVNESGDNYAIWIQADGQTVVANGLTVNAANGRGIKIDEQYVTDAAKVNLTVTNAEFTTAKKAAILVKTAGGADISVANVDISKVKADPINVVWVDEDSADNFNDVTVNGGKPAIESANGAIEGLNYVSLGDSMANGYGFTGYNQGNLIEDVDFYIGKGVYGERAYPNTFAKWLAAKNGAVVHHARLGSSAMRAEDLYYLLGGREKPVDGWFEEVNYYTGVDDDAALAAFFQKEIANADVISMGVGNASFGAYLLHYVTDALGVMGGSLDEDEKVNLEMALIDLDPEQKELVLNIYNDLMVNMANYIPADLAAQYNVQDICDVLAYTTAGFLINYKGALERTVELNPDAEIILVGLMNTTYGMTITMPGMDPIPVGDFMDDFFGALNAYIAGLPTVLQASGKFADATFYYAELPNPRFISQEFDDLKANNWNDVDGLSGAVVRERNIKAYNDSLRELISQAFSGMLHGAPLPKINLEMVNAPENCNPLEQISVAIYLGIEDAVAASTETMEIPLSGLMKIAGDLSGVFAGVQVDPTNIRGSLYNALTANEEMKGMCKIYALFKVGNGMSVHPTPAAHDDLAKAVINAYENGVTAEDQTKENLKVVISDAYAQAYQYALANGYIDMAKNYIDIASDAVLTADNYVHLLVVPAQLEQTRALLQAELANTLETLAEAKALLNISQLTPETWAQILAMEDQLYIHMATLEDLAAELGVVGNIAMDQIDVVANYYAGMIDAIANNAYAWVANGVQEFNAEYAAWVESVGLMADKINPELGAAVRAYLTETPAEALAIMYAAGDDAVVEFIAATAAASDDIKVIITAISAILNSDIADIAAAVKNSAEVAAILAQIDQVKAEIEATVAEMMNHPVSSALAYQQIIDQLKVQLKVLQGQLVDAILNSVDDVDPTLRPLLNKALNALENAIGVAANYGAEYGAWFDARFDEMLGDLLALLINKTNEFGSIAGPILGEAIDNFLHYVGDLAYERGTELLDKIENEIIPEFIDTLKEYGAQAWAKLVAKLEALGILDAVAQAQKDLNYLYELINSYITDDLADAYDTLLDRMTELKDNVADLIETVGNELANTSEEEIRATLAALQEKLENLYNAILALENVVNEAIHGSINTAIAMAQVALNNVAAAVADLAGVLSEDAAAAVADLVNDVKAMLNEAYVDAITDTYTVTPDSYYVALGDSSVFGENTYAQKLAAELGLTTSQFNNLSTAGMSVAETVGLVNANASAIAKADLITIGYSTNTMMEFVIAQLKAATDNGEAQPMDWTALVGEKLVPHVQKALGDITADMLASGVDAQYAELLAVAVEAYAYAAISHALNYPMVVGSIHEINPDALVVIVGMYNPLAGVSVRLSNTETIEIGDYVQKLIDLANMETLAYAMLAPNTIYVDAPDVTTQAQPGEIPVVNFLMGLLTNGTDKYYATEDGHAYIAQQILNALTVAKIGLLGDANNDGIVNSIDSAMILQYDVNMIEANMIFLAVCDVNGDGSVNSIDAAMILQFDVGMIEQFPAALH